LAQWDKQRLKTVNSPQEGRLLHPSVSADPTIRAVRLGKAAGFDVKRDGWLSIAPKANLTEFISPKLLMSGKVSTSPFGKSALNKTVTVSLSGGQ
jgi:hypothetical protein